MVASEDITGGSSSTIVRPRGFVINADGGAAALISEPTDTANNQVQSLCYLAGRTAGAVETAAGAGQDRDQRAEAGRAQEQSLVPGIVPAASGPGLEALLLGRHPARDRRKTGRGARLDPRRSPP